MKVTPAIQSKIQRARDEKGWNNSRLAEAIGKDRSFVSRLLSTTPPLTLKPKVIDNLNDALGIVLFPPFQEVADIFTPPVQSVAALAHGDDAAQDLLASLAKFMATPAPAGVPDLHQKDLIKFGAEISRIAQRWDDPDDPHYAKIAAESLTFLRKLIAKTKR